MNNILLMADSYKSEHWQWSNPDVDFATGYLEPRVKNKHVQVAGVLALFHKLANEYIVTEENVKELVEFAWEHSFGYAEVNEEGFMRIVKEFGGRLPVCIKALPEGTVVDTGIPVLMIRNSHPGFAWVVPYFELIWLHLWKTMDVATNSFNQKLVLARAGKKSMPPEVYESWIPYALHDFGARSTGSNEEAEVGIGHLVNFDGSDNWIATKLFNTVTSSPMTSHSVLALEHNVILGWGEEEEHDLFAEFAEYVLTNGRIGSMLIDTYDVDAAVDWVISNKDRIADWAEIGDFKGKLVLRPDSGDPTDMPVSIIKKLVDNFPTIGYNGYLMLPPWLGVIQGDGNNLERLEKTTERLLAEKLSLSNIVFGEGGELINNYVRDNHGWAFKLSVNTLKDGTEVGCAKRPKDAPEKHSKEGYFSYIEGKLVKADSWEDVEGYEDKYMTCSKGITMYSVEKLHNIRSVANKALNDKL